jgi:hypothetical protein
MVIETRHLFSKKYLKKKMKGGAKKKGGAEDDDVKVITIDPNPNTINESNMVEVDIPDDDNKELEVQEKIEDENEEDDEDGDEDVEEAKSEDENIEDVEDENEKDDDEEELEIAEEEGKTVKKDKSQKLLPQLFGFRDQIKLYHWQTLSHARHVASDTFVTNLNAFIDSFVEIYQGKYGRIKLGKVATIRLEDIDDDSIISYMKKYRNYLTYTLTNSLDSMKDTDLLNIRDEMLADVNKTLYLFSLE